MWLNSQAQWLNDLVIMWNMCKACMSSVNFIKKFTQLTYKLYSTKHERKFSFTWVLVDLLIIGGSFQPGADIGGGWKALMAGWATSTFPGIYILPGLGNGGIPGIGWLWIGLVLKLPGFGKFDVKGPDIRGFCVGGKLELYGEFCDGDNGPGFVVNIGTGWSGASGCIGLGKPGGGALLNDDLIPL